MFLLGKVVIGTPIKPNELTKEMVMKAMQCKDADELDGDNLKKIAGGIFECYMRNDCMYAFDDWK